MNTIDKNLSILIDEMIKMKLTSKLIELSFRMTAKIKPQDLHPADKANYDKIIDYLNHAEDLPVIRYVGN